MSAQGPREAFFEALEAEMGDYANEAHLDRILTRLFLLGYVVAPFEESAEISDTEEAI